MNRRPNVVQVMDLICELRELRSAKVEIALEKQRRIDAQNEELVQINRQNKARNRIWELLRAMDCELRGNTGWEARYEALLLMITDAIETVKTREPRTKRMRSV